MIDQETPGLNDNLIKYGCYLFSILTICENKGLKVPNTAKTINAFYDSLLSNGLKDIEVDCTVESPDIVFGILGIKTKQVFNGKSVEIDRSLIIPKSLEVLCYHWDRKGFIHFCVGDGFGNLLKDPIYRGSNTVKNGYLHSKRLFEVIA